MNKDILDKAKHVKHRIDSRRDRNEPIDLNEIIEVADLEKLIQEIEKLREEYKRYGDTISQIMEERDSLTKENAELKNRRGLVELDRDAFDAKCKRLQAENAELKEENERVLFANREGIDWTGSAREEIKALKAKLAESEKKVSELGLWNRRAEFLRRLYTEAAKDGRLTWDKIDKVMAEDN